MIKLIDILKEDLLFNTNKGFEIYKNPKSIKRFLPNSRAISDGDGNLYVLDDGGMSMVHGEIAHLLKQHGYINFSNWGSEVENINKIPWQRSIKTNNFYLSTSFPELNTLDENDNKKLNKLILLVQKKNPNFIFLKETIY